MPIAELCQLVAVQSKRLMIMLAIMKCKIEIAEANFLWDIYTTMFLICCTNRNDKKSLAHQVPDTTQVLDFIEHVIIAFLSSRALCIYMV
jgi:hypothetical protein